MISNLVWAQKTSYPTISAHSVLLKRGSDVSFNGCGGRHSRVQKKVGLSLMICWHTSGGMTLQPPHCAPQVAAAEVQQQQQYELTPKWVVAQVMHVVDNIPSSDLLPIKLNISPPDMCYCFSPATLDLQLDRASSSRPLLTKVVRANAAPPASVTPFPSFFVRRQPAAVMQCSILRRRRSVSD